MLLFFFTHFMKATFSQVRHPSHPGRGCGSLTCHMTHFEQSDWLRSPNLTNIMIEYVIIIFTILGMDDVININPLVYSLCAEVRSICPNSLRPSDAYMCVGILTIFGSDNGLSSERRQAIIWTSVEILLIGPMETNFSEILFGIQTFSFKKIYLKMSRNGVHFVSTSVGKKGR